MRFLTFFCNFRSNLANFGPNLTLFYRKSEKSQAHLQAMQAKVSKLMTEQAKSGVGKIMEIVKINLPIGKSKSWKTCSKAAYAHPWLQIHLEKRKTFHLVSNYPVTNQVHQQQALNSFCFNKVQLILKKVIMAEMVPESLFILLPL